MSAPQKSSVPASALAFTEAHALLRANARRFFETECAPHQGAWEEEGIAPRAVWKRAGELGFLCPRVDEEYGGLGADFLVAAILAEEQALAGVVAPMFPLHNDVVAPYIAHYGTEAQKREFLPRMIAGETIGAVAMTEPSGGSDLKAMKTHARREGESFVINGQKTFISNGFCADLVILAAKTDRGGGARGISLFLIEPEKVEGFRRGRKLEKLGMKASDTAELFFDDMRVPETALLGGLEGAGFGHLMDRLIEERLFAAIASVATIDRALSVTIQYVKDRRAFGQRILDFQNTRFKLAEAKTEATVLRIFLERCIGEFMAGELDASTAAALKYWATEQQCAIVDDCLQLHGGYGYILDYPIAHMWTDSRITKIYGGANEIMKDIIGRTL